MGSHSDGQVSAQQLWRFRKGTNALHLYVQALPVFLACSLSVSLLLVLPGFPLPLRGDGLVGL